MSTGGGLVKIAGVDKDAMREFLDIEVDEEVWREFKGRRNAALLGVDLARDRELGNRYVWEEKREFVLADFDNMSLYFAGTFVPRDPTLRSVILTGDVFLQEVDGRRGVTNQMLVKLAHRDHVEAASAVINDMVHETDLHAETQQVARDQAGSDLGEMLRYAAHVIAIVAVVILVGLANATSMAVRERVREVGVLRAIGYSRRRIVSLIALESLALSTVGGALGLAAAWATLTYGGISISVGNYAFPVTMSVLMSAGALAGAVAVGVVGALPAGIRASRRPIVDALRSVG
jgi:hypothetical protein